MIVDPKSQALGCIQEQVKELLPTVGFTLDKKAKPDHTKSTLAVRYCITKLALARVMLQQARGTAAKMLPPWTRPQSGSQDASAPGRVWPPAWLLG